MGKLVTKGFTETDGKVVAVTILSYDNNKRARVRNADGTEESVHRGYIFADEKLTRTIADVNWFIHGGGRRESYKPRLQRRRTPKYHVYGAVSQVGQQGQRRGKPGTFRTKAAAVAFASRQASLVNETLEVTSDLAVAGARDTNVWAGCTCGAIRTATSCSTAGASNGRSRTSISIYVATASALANLLFVKDPPQVGLFSSLTLEPLAPASPATKSHEGDSGYEEHADLRSGRQRSPGDQRNLGHRIRYTDKVNYEKSKYAKTHTNDYPVRRHPGSKGCRVREPHRGVWPRLCRD